MDVAVGHQRDHAAQHTIQLAQHVPVSEYSSGGSDSSRGASQQQGVSGAAVPASMGQPADGGPPRKLVILGLPYFTSDETLHSFFSAFGKVEDALVMRDHGSGRSRGFGFVTYLTAEDAARVAGREYTVDGRRCEAKFALPRGETASQRVTRIFVAKLPGQVVEDELRTYFEQFGAIQDVYMPKDASKQARRGIGFVTFSSPEAVDAVMRTSHVLYGQELVVDKAAPKQKEPFPSLMPSLPGMGTVGVGGSLSLSHPYGRLAASHGQLQHDKLGSTGLGSAAFGGLVGNSSYGYGLQQQQQPALPGALSGAGLSGSAGSLGGYDAFGSGAGQDDNFIAAPLAGFLDSDLQTSLQGTAMGIRNSSIGYENSIRDLNAIQSALNQLHALGGSLYDTHSPHLAASLQQPQRPAGAPGSANSLTDLDRVYANSQGAQQQHVPAGSLRFSQQLRGPGVPSSPAMPSGPYGTEVPPLGQGGASGQGAAGPLSTNRVFIGKLSKDITEADIKEYCSRFGYVLDVYIPRDKNNKREHRGFGFVTFETEAAVDRILAFDDHQIHGNVIAVDRALPRQEDTSQSGDQAMAGSGHGCDGNPDAVSAALSMAALGLGVNGQMPGPARHNNDRSRYSYQPY